VPGTAAFNKALQGATAPLNNAEALVMNKFALTVTLATALLGSAALAQTTPQRSGSTGDAAIVRVDVARVAVGQRASKLVGATVVNSNDESIGKIDDLVVNPQDKVTYAVISVGGFLGVGNKLVAVPFDSLKTVKEERLMLPGATKDALKSLPEFKYARG
jgi:sporulation protein YlmC with PRC-barrel domain